MHKLYDLGADSSKSEFIKKVSRIEMLWNVFMKLSSINIILNYREMFTCNLNKNR